MRVTPFPPRGQGRPRGTMGDLADLLPQTHALFVGPMQCARHAFSALATRANTSTLVVTDVETALGQTEQRIAEAVDEIAASEPDVRAFVLLTACQTAFLGIDFAALCRTLHERTGLCFAHVEMNRMDAANIPGPTRRNVPGGDRFHMRLRLFRMLEQRELAGGVDAADTWEAAGVAGNAAAADAAGPGEGAAVAEAGGAPGDGAASGAEGAGGNVRAAGGVDAAGTWGAAAMAGSPVTSGGRGLLVLADEGVAPASDLRDYLLLQGIEWVRAVPDLEDFGQFLQCRDAAAVAVTSMQWKETGEYLQRQFGIPALYLPVGYALEEVEGACAQLDAALRGCGTPGQWRALRQARAQSRAQAQEGVRRALRACPALELDLNNAQRPFSLVEALLGYGFDVRDLSLAQMRIEHKEDDDAPAFRRLARRFPEWGERFEGVGSLRRGLGMAPGDPGKPGAAGGLASGGRSGVSGESAWWGYSSIVQLMARIEHAGAQEAEPADPADPDGESAAPAPDAGWGWRA